MNIQDNCLNIPEKPTERNFGLLLSKKYRAKIAERYNNFFYKKFFKKIPNKYVLKFDAYSDLEIIEYALSRITSGQVKTRSDLPIENIYKLNQYSITKGKFNLLIVGGSQGANIFDKN